MYRSKSVVSKLSFGQKNLQCKIKIEMKTATTTALKN